MGVTAAKQIHSAQGRDHHDHSRVAAPGLCHCASSAGAGAAAVAVAAAAAGAGKCRRLKTAEPRNVQSSASGRAQESLEELLILGRRPRPARPCAIVHTAVRRPCSADA